MPRFKTCVVYTAQNDYLIEAANIEEAAALTEKEFKVSHPYPAPWGGACLEGVKDEGTAWQQFKYVGTIQELPADQEKGAQQETSDRCPNCGAKSAVVLVPPDDIELAVCDTCGWESTDKDPAEEDI